MPLREMKIDIESWWRDGYAILPGFYSGAQIDAASRAQLRAWDERAPRIVVDDLNTGQRLRMMDVSEADRRLHRFKINDLFLEVPAIRALGLNERITPILSELLGQTPVLCNSLSFEHGSGQPDHVDALYMTPRSAGHLIAIWVALEDCHSDAGPLRYYPGSHRIPPHVFSNGSHHFVPDEMEEWRAYMQDEVAKRSLSPLTFAARKGDVFVWNAYLLHGGTPIRDPSRTRKSLVFHYYSEADCRDAGSRVYPDGYGGYWMYKSHQPVDGAEAEWPPGPDGVPANGGRPALSGWLSRLRRVFRAR